MNLSVKKLRRSATVIGGSFLGLGIAAALATPALACNSTITGVPSCVNADGTWSVTWSVTSDKSNTAGTIIGVHTTPDNAQLTNIVVDKAHPVSVPAQGQAPLTGVETLGADDTKARLQIVVSYPIGDHHKPRPITDSSPIVDKPSQHCTPPSTPPTTKPTTKPTTPPTTKPATHPTTTAPTPAPSTSAPVLAITGSSSGPLAGGAVALVLVGGGAFFMARRRKMKFTA